jgi:hypothetical protein
MSITSGKILVLRLFERRSKKGNQYWIGKLGAAKVVAFPNTQIELKFDAVGAIDVFVQAGNGDDDGGDRPSRELPGESQPPSDAPIRPSRDIERYRVLKTEQPLADPEPFNDDGSNLWEDDR